MQLRNIATRFRVLVSLSLSTACYLKNRIRRAFTFSRAFFLSLRMPCLPANNTYIVLCVYIYTKCLRIITSEYQEYYINQEILRNLYIKNAFNCIDNQITRFSLFITKTRNFFSWYFWAPSLCLNRLLSQNINENIFLHFTALPSLLKQSKFFLIVKNTR